MAFDDTTRGRLQTFVTKARTVLTDEFTKQFQQDFGLDPASGTVTPLESLTHLDDQRFATARLLREIFEHYLPAAMSSGTEARKTTLDRMVREQAFTTLNRLAALRMMEARGLVLECVGKAYQSKAFQLYQRVAGTALGETGDAYRVFLLSLCDIYCTDLPVLFDRHFPNGRLFPHEPALLPLLDLINASDIAPLWAEDETIGWIYQYFNDADERKRMRDPKQGGSQAPRNSRELAVRNQFFTPRYVVEFLVDNTLGRLWFNWTGGQTGLLDRCQYLLVKPNEGPAPAQRLRDPRTIKLLDPACGSMHFGLYAFDLFMDIYREAWAWEQQHGPDCLDVATGGAADLKPLCQTYADEAALMRDAPRLIIEHNIFGVDIDPRAAQIAALALWLRAQRAWHDAGVKALDRPAIGRGHVVAAVAPPAEIELRRNFMETLDPLDADLFMMTLVMLKGLPELGVLLQVELEMPRLVKKVFGEHGDLFKKEDVSQWRKAEARLQEALAEFARAARASYQGRLFAEDALQGLRVIDICREVFDVVLMNPPFGLPSPAAREYIDEYYQGAHGDIYCSFVRRATQLSKRGYVGCITSSSFLLSPRLEAFRTNIIERLYCVADCGLGVMDEAMVRAAIYVIGPIPCASLKAANLKPHLREIKNGAPPSIFVNSFYPVDKQSFLNLPQTRLLIDAPPNVLQLLSKGPYFEPIGGTAREGMKTFDNERFIRLPWEVHCKDIGKGKHWNWLAKGGEFSFFFAEINLVLNWSNDGAELKEINLTLNGSTAQVRQASSYWGLEGATYSKRAAGFSARALPKDCIFTSNGPAILPLNGTDPLYLLGWLNSRPIRALSHLNAGAYDQYSTGALKRLPWKKPQERHVEQIRGSVADAISSAKRFASQFDECSRWFIKVPIRPTLEMTKYELERLAVEKNNIENSTLLMADEIICDVYEFRSLEWVEPFLNATIDDMEQQNHDETKNPDAKIVVSNLTDADIAHRIVSYLVGLVFGRWNAMAELVTNHAEKIESAFEPPAGLQPGATLPGTDQKWLAVLPTTGSPDAGLAELISSRIGALYKGAAELEHSCSCALSVLSIENYLIDCRGFFASHLSQYTLSKRQAPIYWPLSTISGKYTLWVYYPNLSSQTLYTAVNDFIEGPNGKLKQVEQEAAALRAKGSSRSRDEDKKLEALQTLETELIDLRDTLLRIAPTYHPNHDDGVQITAAPLWPLFRHKPWQKLLKDTWAKLEKGDYDWAHLAMSYWPDRVRENCKTDKSLAIAHDLEHLYVEPAPKPSKARGKKGAGA